MKSFLLDVLKTLKIGKEDLELNLESRKSVPESLTNKENSKKTVKKINNSSE